MANIGRIDDLSLHVSNANRSGERPLSETRRVKRLVEGGVEQPVTVLSPDEAHLSITSTQGFRTSSFKTFRHYILVVVFNVLYALYWSWFQPHYLRSRFDEVEDPEEAEYVLVTDAQGRQTLVDVEVVQTVSNYEFEDSPELASEYRRDSRALSAVPVEDRMIYFRNRRFLYNSTTKAFELLRAPAVASTADLFRRADGVGLSHAEMNARAQVYGRNAMQIAVESIPRMLINELLQPFFVFQVYSVILWFFELYFIFASVIAAMAAVTVTLNLRDTRRNLFRLRELARTHATVTVVRGLVPGQVPTVAALASPTAAAAFNGNGSTSSSSSSSSSASPSSLFTQRPASALVVETISSTELVPGDVLLLDERGDIPCDMTLLTGSVVVNEAMLTGESVPVVKAPIVESLSAGNVLAASAPQTPAVFTPTLSSLASPGISNTLLVPPATPMLGHVSSPLGVGGALIPLGKDPRVTLFAGSRIVQLKHPRISSQSGSVSAEEKQQLQGAILAMVVSTGFATTKGNMVSAMLYPPKSSFRFVQQSYKYIGLLFIVAAVGFAFAIWRYNALGAETRVSVLRAFDLITIVVPPSLPLAMTVGIAFSLVQLQKAKIFCIAPARINLAGKIKMMCFDKTGTLTSDSLQFRGIHSFLYTAASPSSSSSSSSSSLSSSSTSSVMSPSRTVSVSRIESMRRSTTSATGHSPAFTFDPALLPDSLRAVLAACHSLVRHDSEFIGDPLELEAFKAAHASYSEPRVGHGVMFHAHLNTNTLIDAIDGDDAHVDSSNGYDTYAHDAANGFGKNKSKGKHKRRNNNNNNNNNKPTSIQEEKSNDLHDSDDGAVDGGEGRLRSSSYSAMEAGQRRHGAAGEITPDAVALGDVTDAALTPSSSGSGSGVLGVGGAAAPAASTGSAFPFASPAAVLGPGRSVRPGTRWAVLKQFPFEAKLQRMGVIAMDEATGQTEMFAKGAPEMLVRFCDPVSVPDNFAAVVDKYTHAGFRVIALARRPINVRNPGGTAKDAVQTHIDEMARAGAADAGATSVLSGAGSFATSTTGALVAPLKQVQLETKLADAAAALAAHDFAELRSAAESGLTLLGLLVLENAIKAETMPTLEALRLAGVRSVMVTGDNAKTAVSIAKECGIVPKDSAVFVAHVTKPESHEAVLNTESKERSGGEGKEIGSKDGEEASSKEWQAVLTPDDIVWKYAEDPSITLDPRTLLIRLPINSTPSPAAMGAVSGTGRSPSLTAGQSSGASMSIPPELSRFELAVTGDAFAVLLADHNRVMHERATQLALSLEEANSTATGLTPSSVEDYPHQQQQQQQQQRGYGYGSGEEHKSGGSSGHSDAAAAAAAAAQRVSPEALKAAMDVVAPTSDDWVPMSTTRAATRLQRVVLGGAVFARMTPDQKAALVAQYQHLGLYTGMCGDGANDCAALKTAHVGVSLAESEASIAAPFTSLVPNISCVPKLLCEGRSSLVTSFQLFRYMSLYSFVQFSSAICLYFSGGNYCDYQYLYQDLFVVFPLVLLLGRTPASSQLTKKRPSANLLSGTNLSSIAMHMVVAFVMQIMVYLFSRRQPDYEVDDSEPWLCYMWEATSLHWFASLQYILFAFLFAFARPWKKYFVSNVGLTFWLIGVTVASVLMFLLPTNSAFFLTADNMNLSASWKSMVLIIFAIQVGISFMIEFVIVPTGRKIYDRRREHIRTNTVFGKGNCEIEKGAKPFHLLRREFEDSWPENQASLPGSGLHVVAGTGGISEASAGQAVNKRALVQPLLG